MNNQEINQTEKLENTNIMPTNLQANSITPPNIIQTPSNNALEPIKLFIAVDYKINT